MSAHVNRFRVTDDQQVVFSLPDISNFAPIGFGDTLGGVFNAASHRPSVCTSSAHHHGVGFEHLL
jgi:hypothetical protein